MYYLNVIFLLTIYRRKILYIHDIVYIILDDNEALIKISVSGERGTRSAILAAREIASSPSTFMAHEKLSYAFSVWRMEGDWSSSL